VLAPITQLVVGAIAVFLLLTEEARLWFAKAREPL
jgi:hypothetical protein